MLVMAALAGASVARSRHEVSRTEAIRSALTALHVHSRSGAEIVFALRSPVPAGTVVRDGGPARPSSGRRAVHSNTRRVAKARGRSWFFYEDLAPFQEYAHAGRVVLVDVASGRVTVSRKLSWPPTLNGRLPVFLASQSAYLGSRYRVFYRPYVGAAVLANRASARMSAPGVRLVPAALDPTQGAQVAALLASQHACVVRFSDTVRGGYYAFAHIAQSRAALAFRFSQLANFSSGFQSFIYSRTSRLSPTAFIADQISSHGCKDVMLYMAGGGYPGAGAVNIGMGINVADPLHQDVTAAALRGLAGTNPGVNFELVLDAPFTSPFGSLEGIKNVLLVASPVAPGGGSFTYLPEARVGGRLVANDTNPLHILQLTDRLAYGLDRVIDNPAEVAQLEALNQAGKLPSVLAYILARAFALGGPVDFVARTGVGSPPSVHFHGFTAGPPNGGAGGGGGGGGTPPPGTPVVSAHADSYAATNDATLTRNAAAGVLANDTDSAQHPLTVDQLNGAGGTAPFTDTSTKGAAVTLNADGSFTYDPTGSSTLQAIPRGQTTTDTFTYRANDGQGGTSNAATVTVTVTGHVNHPPVATADTASTDKQTPVKVTVLANDSDLDQDALTVASVDTTGTLGKVTINPDNTITYDPNGQFNSLLNVGQSMTDSFKYKANDGFADSNAATVTVTINGLNVAPVLSGIESSAVSYQAGGPGVIVTSDLQVADPDDANLSGATVAISSGFTAAEDSLSFTSPPGSGISDVYQAATGVLALSGSSSKANYQTALRSVKYADSSGGSPNTGARTISFQVDDGHLMSNLSNTVTRNISVTANPPPTATDFAAVTDEKTATDITVFPAHASDSDGDTLTVSGLDTAGTKGLATINPGNATIHYDPNGQFTSLPQGVTATDTFKYKVNDGFSDSSFATVTVTITGTNEAPTAVDDTGYTTDENTRLSNQATVLTNDTDPDTGEGGTNLAVASYDHTSTDGAAVTMNTDGTFSYDPTGSATLEALGVGQQATDTFTYQAKDVHGTLSNSATVSIVVNGVNDPPTAADNTNTTDENTVITAASTASGQASNLLTGAADPDTGDTLSVVAAGPITTAKGATVTVNADGSYSYDPTASTTLEALGVGASTTDTFNFTVSDNHGALSGSKTATITVSGVNDAPVAAADSYGTDVPSALPNNKAISVPRSGSEHGVLFNDTDVDTGDTLSVKSFGTSGTNLTGTTADGATVTLATDGSFSYDPTTAPSGGTLRSLAIDATTTDTFQYTVQDNHGATDHATVSVLVKGADTPPTANPVSANAVGNTLLEFGTQVSPSSEPKTTVADSLNNYVSDPDPGDSATVTATDATSSQGGNVSFNLASGGFAYRPKAGFTGIDTFHYIATDTHNVSTQGTVTITVSNMVWYVNSSAGAAGDGRSGSPFQALGSAQSASAPNDTIYVFKGNSGTAPYGAIALQNSQTLQGENHDLIVGGHTLATATSNRPVILNASGDGVTLASGDTVEGFDITGTNAGKFAIAGGSGDASGTIADNILHGASTGGGLNLNATSGTWAVSDLTATGTGAAAFDANAAGTVNFTGTNSLTGTAAAAFKNAGATTYSATIATTSSTGGTANGIDVSGAGGSITFNGGTISGTTANAILASGGSANITYNGTETNTAGHSLNVNTRTGGTISIQSTINDTGTGITITNNAPGTTINLTGGVTSSTAANTAFNATGGGTVTVTGATNALTTTTGTALNVQNTNIGSSGLTFRSITAGTTTGSLGDGIVLDTTGSSGGLTVTGSSSGACGGAVTGSTPSLAVTAPNSADCTGGVIQHKTGSDGSTTSGIGIYLNNTANVSLTRMSLHDFDNFGIFGSGVSGLTISNSQFTGSNGTNQNGSGEGAAYLFGLSGSTSVTNSFFSGGALDSFHLENNGSQVLNRITFTGDNFGDTLNATSASALFMQADCTAQLKATVDTSVFTAARANNLNVSIRGQSTDDLVVSNSQFSNSDANQVSGGSNLAVGAGGPSSGCADNTLNPTLTYNIHNNTFRDALGTAVSISKGGVGTGTFGTTANPGIIDHNTFGVSGNSASSGAGGIGSILVGGGSITNNITNNTIHGAINAINIGANSSVAGGGQGFYRAVIQGNTVDTPNVGLGNITNGLLAQFGAVSTDNPKACLTLGGSTAALKTNLDGGRNGGADLRLRVRFGTLIGIIGYSGANNDDAAMTSFLNSQDVFGIAGAIVTNNAITGSGWTGTCPT